MSLKQRCFYSATQHLHQIFNVPLFKLECSLRLRMSVPGFCFPYLASSPGRPEPEPWKASSLALRTMMHLRNSRAPCNGSLTSGAPRLDKPGLRRESFPVRLVASAMVYAEQA